MVETTETTETTGKTPIDMGDEVSPEQAEIAKSRGAIEENDPMTDEEVEAAIEAMKAASGETEDEDEEEDEDENEDEDEDEEEKEDPLIPKTRFDAAVNKERKRADDAERRLANLERQGGQPTSEEPQKTAAELIGEKSDELRDLRTKWQDAIFDNDQSAARGFLEEITEAEDELSDLRLDAKSIETRHETNDDIRFDRELTQLEEDYPVIDEAHASYDPEINRRMTRLYTILLNGGASKVAALREAADVYVLSTPKRKKSDKSETLRGKAKESLAKTLKDQPPEPDGHQDTAPVLKPSRLSDEQFEKLSEEQRAILRGDVI